MFATEPGPIDGWPPALQATFEAELARRTAALRAYAAHLISSGETAKARLARELHDELGGLLTAAKLDLARLRSKVGADEVSLARIAQIGDRLSHGIALKRRIVEDLRPSSLATLGLSASLANLCEETSARLGIPVHIDLPAMPLDCEADLTVYRVVQEALDNVARHAGAHEVHVSLAQAAQGVHLRVVDDGSGFAREASGHGIEGMAFRIEQLGGVFTVDSKPGHGTIVDALIPTSAPPR